MHSRKIHVPELSIDLASYCIISVVQHFYFPPCFVFPAEPEPKVALLCLLCQDRGCTPQLVSSDSKGCQEPLGRDSHEALDL